MKITRSNNGIGADVHDIDLSRQLSLDEVEFIKNAWSENLVLRFRKQNLNEEMQIGFTRSLGEIAKAPARSASLGYKDGFSDYIIKISNVVENGTPIGELGDGEAVWHQDMTYIENPPVAGILAAKELPTWGGNTYFSNLYAAYDDLDEETKQQISTLRVIHDITYDSAGKPRAGHTPTTNPLNAQGPNHPLVKTHPKSGRKYLFLGRRPWAYIIGLKLEESERLLNKLWEHSNNDKYVWKQEWELGDVILWDNRCTLHRRDAFDPSSARIMNRTTVAID